MGKIKKIKQERKRAEVEAQIKKAKNRRFIFQLFTILVLVFAITGIFSYGYHYADVKWQVGDKLANYKSKIFKKESEKKVAENQTNERKTYTQAPEMQIDVAKKYIAKFETSNGNFEVELYADKAPKTVNNFVVLSRDGFYNGLTFHRIIQDFMIQGGDPSGDGTGGPGYKFEDEINDVKLVRGVLAMANSGEDTNGSQFFIVTKDATDWLDGKHTAFGKVTNGLDVVMEIEKAEVGENDKPTSPVTINKITIEEN